MRISKKEVKTLKNQLTVGILHQMNFGEYLSNWTEYYDNGSREEKSLLINSKTEYIPSSWHAGIYSVFEFNFGIDFARVNFASEEAKRIVRDMFPSQADFITWAWYN